MTATPIGSGIRSGVYLRVGLPLLSTEQVERLMSADPGDGKAGAYEIAPEPVLVSS